MHYKYIDVYMYIYIYICIRGGGDVRAGFYVLPGRDYTKAMYYIIM